MILECSIQLYMPSYARIYTWLWWFVVVISCLLHSWSHNSRVPHLLPVFWLGMCLADGAVHTALHTPKE